MRRAARAALMALAGVLAGCGYLPRPAVVPMPTLLDRSMCAAPADTLLVLLPGRGMLMREFADEGFLRAVQERRLAVDVLRADAHVGYYEDDRIVERLRTDLFAPARAQGYRRIWLAGISMGGIGALAYVSERPADIAGVVVLAPYLGERDASSEVEAAGGLRAWTPPTSPPDAKDIGRRIWHSLQPWAMAADPAGRPPIYLGYGLDDRLAWSHRVLAAALPAGRVATTPGGHDWPEWRRLWNTLLDRLPLPACAG